MAMGASARPVSSSATPPSGSGGVGSKLATLRLRLNAMLGGPSANRGLPAAGASFEVAAERRRWSAERRELLDDCTAVRAQVAAMQRTLDGWSALLRDLLYYGALHGREAAIEAAVVEVLGAALGEVEGVQEVELAELSLPSGAEAAPNLTLRRYGGAGELTGRELSEWCVEWSPPPAIGGCITLRGRKFGVSFSIAATVSNLKLRGTLCCRWTPTASPPALTVGFKGMPEVAFELALAGKALSLGSDTLRAWLQRQLRRQLTERCVLPKMVEISLPSAAANSHQHDARDLGEPEPDAAADAILAASRAAAELDLPPGVEIALPPPPCADGDFLEAVEVAANEARSARAARSASALPSSSPQQPPPAQPHQSPPPPPFRPPDASAPSAVSIESLLGSGLGEYDSGPDLLESMALPPTLAPLTAGAAGAAERRLRRRGGRAATAPAGAQRYWPNLPPFACGA